jgi:hypothetical protein
MKAKIKREGNKLDITIKGNTFTKYMNKCILCGNESIDDINKGAKHICENCYKLFEDNKTRGTNKVKDYIAPPIAKKHKKEPVKMGFSDRTVALSETNTIMTNITNYKPSIKIVYLVDYQNLMEAKGIRINGKVVTALIDLIIKGINSANKIAKHLGITNEKTIHSLRTYLRRMERFGMVRKTKRMPNEGYYNNIFTVDPRLVYTQC